MARISGIQRRLEIYKSQKLVELEQNLQLELERVLDYEELLLKQKSCKDWLNFEDRNTKYFHNQVNMRRRVNHIKSLKLGDGS